MRPAVDLAPIRCPDLRPADRRLLAAPSPQPPAGDLTTPRVREWVDSLDLHIAALRKAGYRIAQTYDACRNAAAATS